MTNDQFLKNKLYSGQKIIYHGDGKEYEIVTVDFDEQLIGFYRYPDNDNTDITWVRYENCEFIN